MKLTARGSLPAPPRSTRYQAITAPGQARASCGVLSALARGISILAERFPLGRALHL